ncbi:MAG: AraC family transcriptional regulator [Prevotellaceae bacterium]|nr:AraC family transcriptional regulator [Prevotellaceae bacterium]
MMHLLGIDDIRHPLVEIIDMEKAVNPQKFNGSAISIGFYMIVYKERNCGPLTYGLSKYDYDSGTLLFFAPDQEIGIEDVGDPRGKILMFSPDLLSRTLLDTMMHRYTFFSYAVNEALHISEREKEQFFSALASIEEELEHPQDKHSRELVVTLIQLLLSHSLRYYDRQFISREVVNAEHGDQFRKLLMDYYNTNALHKNGMPNVRYFADKMNMTPNYFGDMIKKSLGVSPLQYIQEYVISLAKQQLLASKSSISEIAYGLGFEYPQYFTRLFKKITGQTPNEFRTAN